MNCMRYKYKSFSYSQLAYLRSLLSYHTITRSLRSANTNLLSVPVSTQLLSLVVLALQPHSL